MIYKQCKFKDFAAIDNNDDWIGGIAILKTITIGEEGVTQEKLDGVICGCCGSFIEADEIVVIKYFEDWVDISEKIIEE